MFRELARIVGVVLLVLGSVVAAAAEPPTITGEMFDRWMTELNNWGR